MRSCSWRQSSYSKRQPPQEWHGKWWSWSWRCLGRAWWRDARGLWGGRPGHRWQGPQGTSKQHARGTRSFVCSDAHQPRGVRSQSRAHAFTSSCLLLPHSAVHAFQHVHFCGWRWRPVSWTSRAWAPPSHSSCLCIGGLYPHLCHLGHCRPRRVPASGRGQEREETGCEACQSSWRWQPRDQRHRDRAPEDRQEDCGGSPPGGPREAGEKAPLGGQVQGCRAWWTGGSAR